MKSTVFITSSSGNVYMYDFLKKELIPIHEIVYLCYLLDQKSKLENLLECKTNSGVCITDLYCSKEIQYYYQKYLRYKASGFFRNFRKSPFSIYTEQKLEETISNLNNIVFEVTDSCNLQCQYCTYGTLYDHHDLRQNRKMSFDVVRTIFDYLIPYWNSDFNKSLEQIVSIGFYGGEPLLNFDLIERTVDFCDK